MKHISYLLAITLTAGWGMTGSASAQNDVMGRVFGPIIPGSGGVWHEDLRWVDATETEKDQPSVQWWDYQAAYTHHWASTNRSEWMVLAGFRMIEISETLRLSASDVEIPNDLYDVEAGLGRRWLTERGNLAGWFALVGSASDRPFQSYDETSLMLNAFYRYSQSRESAWLWMANYSNRRSFLPHIPLVGVAWQYTPSRRRMALLGFPFSMLRWTMGRDMTGLLTYMPADRLRLEFEKPLTPSWSVALGGERYEDSFFPSDRNDADDTLYFTGDRAYLKTSWKATRRLTLHAGTAYEAGRRIHLGEDDDDDEDRLDLDDGWTFSASLTWRY